MQQYPYPTTPAPATLADIQHSLSFINQNLHPVVFGVLPVHNLPMTACCLIHIRCFMTASRRAIIGKMYQEVLALRAVGVVVTIPQKRFLHSTIPQHQFANYRQWYVKQVSSLSQWQKQQLEIKMKTPVYSPSANALRSVCLQNPLTNHYVSLSKFQYLLSLFLVVSSFLPTNFQFNALTKLNQRSRKAMFQSGLRLMRGPLNVVFPLNIECCEEQLEKIYDFSSELTLKLQLEQICDREKFTLQNS